MQADGERLLTPEKRIGLGLGCLRAWMLRAVDELVRATHGGRVLPPDITLQQLTYNIHVVDHMMLFYATMVVADGDAVVEARRHRSECWKRALESVADAGNLELVRRVARALVARAKVTDPSYQPRKVEVHGEAIPL